MYIESIPVEAQVLAFVFAMGYYTFKVIGWFIEGWKKDKHGDQT